jgi:hypothetical protein
MQKHRSRFRRQTHYKPKERKSCGTFRAWAWAFSARPLEFLPDVLRDLKSRLPQATADLEREMMKHAGKFGLSAADIRAQVRAIEEQSRQ